jgi:hypothetical protein
MIERSTETQNIVANYEFKALEYDMYIMMWYDTLTTCFIIKNIYENIFVISW